VRNDVYVRALTRAANLLGSKQAVAEYLRVPQEELQCWLGGGEPMPLEVFSELVDLLLAMRLAELRREQSRDETRTPTAP
jgi:hypothetical protein